MEKELKIKLSTVANLQGINETKQGLNDLEKESYNVEASQTSLTSVFSNTSQSIHGVTGYIKGLVGAYISLSSAQSLLSTAGQFEQYQTSLKVLSGSAEQAEKSFAWVKEFTAKTPYLLNETMEAFIRLKAYGIDATDGSLKTLGDTASAMGKPLMSAVEAMADAMTGENERLKEFGVTASKSGDTIAYKWIDSSGKAKTQIIQNNSEIIKSTLETIFNEKYSGMMDEQSKTWVGAVSNLEDTWTSFKDEFARSTGMFDSAKSSIQSLTGFVSGLNENLDSAMPMIKGVAIATGVMYASTKSAAIVEGIYASAKDISTAATASNAVIIAEETKAQQMGTYAQTIRAAADRASSEAKLSNLIMAERHAMMLAKEATEAELAALAQTKNAYAMREAGASSGLMGTALKAIPFLAVAGTVATLATWFFESTKRSDDLRSSLNATAESLAKLTAAQLTNKRQNLAIESQGLSLEIRKLKQEYGSKKERTTDEQAEIDDLEAQYRDLGNAMKLVAKAQTDIRNGVKSVKTEPVSNKILPPSLTDKELKDAAKAAEQLKKLNQDLNDEIFKATASEHEKAMKLIDDGVAKFRDGGANKIKIAQLISIKQEEYLEAEYAKSVGQFDALDKETTEKTKSRLAISEEMYTKLNDLSGNWYDNELLNTSKWVNDYIEKGGDIEKANEYLNASILKLDQKRFKEEQELNQKRLEEENAFWIDLMGNIDKAMENQFFDAMTGKFNSFGDWLKDFWGSITDSMARGLSKTLADYVMGGAKSGIQNVFSTYGGLGSVFGASMTAPALLGAATDAAGFTTTSGGTVFDAAGQITKEGEDLSSVVSALSNAKSLYSLATNGLTAAMYAPSMYMGQLAGYAYGAGLTGTGSFLAGGANVLAGGGLEGLGGAAYAGGLATTGVLGGVGGYALGSLGDALFGSNTRAGEYGAIGGSLGAMIGSVVPGIGTLIGGVAGSVLGSVIGGMFGGGTSATGSGINVKDLGAYDISNIQAYTSWHEDGGWFSGDNDWNTFDPLSTTQKTAIKGTFDAYNYLLEQLGVSGKVFAKSGLYSAEAFNDMLAKSFIGEFTGISKTLEEAAATSASTIFDGIDSVFVRAFRLSSNVAVENAMINDIYSYWADYAKSIDKTVAEALTGSVGSYISTGRSFEEWKLGSGTSDQLKFTSDYLTKDLAALENMMGVSGVTVDNFLTMYDEAIKNSFTPETITQWNSLAESLMKATDANKSYTDSLKALTAQTVKPADMMLGKVNDATRTTQGDTLNTQLLVQIVKTLKSIQTTNQFSTGGALV